MCQSASYGPEVADWVHDVLQTVLSLSTLVVHKPSNGLLTSMLDDRAYLGLVRNKADMFMRHMLKLGLADNIHCCTAAASHSWHTTHRKAGKRLSAKGGDVVASSGAPHGKADSSGQ